MTHSAADIGREITRMAVNGWDVNNPDDLKAMDKQVLKLASASVETDADLLSVLSCAQMYLTDLGEAVGSQNETDSPSYVMLGLKYLEASIAALEDRTGMARETFNGDKGEGTRQ